jgi:hypothetical protein
VSGTIVGLIAAAATIIAAIITAITTNRIMKKIAAVKFQRERLDETYQDVLRGVTLREAQIKNSLEREEGAPSRTAASEYDPTTADETQFGARMLAYASPEVEQLWRRFVEETKALDRFLDAIRGRSGMAPGTYLEEVGEVLKCLVSVDPLEEHFKAWSEILTQLRAQIRTELAHPERVGKIRHNRPPPAVQDMTPSGLQPSDEQVGVTFDRDPEASL